MKLEDRDWCFGCGSENPIGLHLKFTSTHQGVKTTFVPEQKHEGYKGITHGGLIATLFDEAFAWACKRYAKVMTISLAIKFIHPARIGKPIHIEARVSKSSRKYIYGIAKAKTSGGKVLAEAKGKFAKLKKSLTNL